ncbi:hypothetical protein BJ742DRAFT_771290 [Cladochytrium replicatum]|nr:hypothetical protein BJ742DRAFT_771290 [Cladochytrium replicatum]
MPAYAIGLDPHGAAVAGAYAAIGNGATLYFGGLVNDTISPSSYSPALSQNPSDEIYEISSVLELRKVETSLSPDGGVRPPPTYFQCCVSDPSSNFVVSFPSNSSRGLKDLVLCYGGVDVTSHMWIYHWPSKTWLAPEILNSDPPGQVEVGRYGHSCAIADGRVSVLGGIAKWSDGSTGPAKSHLLFDLTKPTATRWKTKALSSLSSARDVRLGHTLVPITSQSIQNAQKPEPFLMLFGSNAANYTGNITSSDPSQNTVPLVVAFDSTSPSRIGRIDTIGSIPDIMDGAACTTVNQMSVYCFGGRRRTSAAELSGQIWRLQIENLNVTADSTYSWSGASWELIWDTASTPTGPTLFPGPRWGASMTSINNTYLTIWGGGTSGDFLNPKTVAPFADPQLYVFDLRNQSWGWHSSADWRRQLEESVNNTSFSPSPTATPMAGALQPWGIAVTAIGGLILVLVAVVAVGLRRTRQKHRRKSAHALEQGKARGLVPGYYHLVSAGPPQIPPLIVPDPFQSLTEDELGDQHLGVLSEHRSSTQTQDRRLLRIRESSTNDDDRLSTLFTSIHSSLSSKGPSHRSWDVSSSTPPAGDLGSRSARASGNGMGAAGAVASDLELLVGSDPIAVAAAVAERHRNVVPLLNRLTRSNVDAREFFPGSLEERESLGSVGGAGAVYVEGTERRSTARSSGTAEMMATLERIAGTEDLFEEDAESAKLLIASSAEEGESTVAPASDIPTVPEDEIRPAPSVIFVPHIEEIRGSPGEEVREGEADELLNSNMEDSVDNNLEDSIDLGSDIAQVGVGSLVVGTASDNVEDSNSPIDELDQAGDRSSKIVEVGQLLIDEIPVQPSASLSPLSVLDSHQRHSVREATSETTTMRNPSVPMYPIPSQWNLESTPPGSPKRGPLMWPSPPPLHTGVVGTVSRASSAAGSGASTPLAVQWPPPPPVGVDEPDLMIQVHGQSTDYVVTRAFWPSRPDEIPLEVGDLIAIECRWDDNWARGQNVSKSRRRGVFPLSVLSAIRSGPSHRVAGLSSPPRSRSGSVEGRSASSSGSSSPEPSETTGTASASTTPVLPPRGRFLAEPERFAVGAETKMMPRSSSLYRTSAGAAVAGKEVAEALSRLA